MSFKHLSILLVGTLAAAGAAFGYTMPTLAPYDALISVDHGGTAIIPGTFHVNAGIGYWSASKMWDADGESWDDDAKPTAILVPIDLGYAFNEFLLADVTVEIDGPSYKGVNATTGAEETFSTFGLGDVWVKGRYLFPGGNGWTYGPRLGVKIPVGKVDDESGKPDLGDDQMDIDVAAVGAMDNESLMFKFNGQLGFRYRMKRTLTIELPPPLEPVDVDYVPGMMIYTHLEPGIALGDGKFRIFIPIGYETSMAAKLDDETVDKSETSMLYAGLGPRYRLDENNDLGLKLFYPVMGANVEQAMYFTLNYEAFIKF